VPSLASEIGEKMQVDNMEMLKETYKDNKEPNAGESDNLDLSKDGLMDGREDPEIGSLKNKNCLRQDRVVEYKISC
jgi:hypothetical protein